MCKPGSACRGSGVTSGGACIALAVLGTVAAVGMASVVVSAILTALLVTVFSVAAGGIVIVVIVLRRTRGVVTWPMGVSRVPAAGPPRPPVPVRALPAPRPDWTALVAAAFTPDRAGPAG